MNPSSESRRELDSTVVNIELTLASIIQGVALFFLTDNARVSMSVRHWENFLYVAAGLCVIFIFWSRSIIHTLTLIKWPLEFGHNFFLHRLRTWRVNSFQPARSSSGVVSTKRRLCSSRLAAFHLRHAADPRTHHRIEQRCR